MAHSGQVVNFIGLYLLHVADNIAGVCQVAIEVVETRVAFFSVFGKEVVNAGGVEAGAATLHTPHGVALRQKVLG